ncbi:OmpA family protein [Hymenobacter caeli]|uniref:Outer membrane protein OmpA-like peptidoglycan-associated protein n=1 Tax=Hymenobacter caeli TaxID=2735894 RepID=A0ABX2FV50_9BACT|nr:OmpA family protein [Hymenobacter caeli]NRT20876.1 outer membrane protein OmpA-like peptidoglycan-associated protein [Hymenobacter caeli]
MRRSFWYGLGAWLLAGPLQAQSLAGVWQGVETDTGVPDGYWPAVLRVQKSRGNGLFGVLYQELGGSPGVSVTFQMQGVRAGGGMRLEHVRKLNETGHARSSYWCDGSITFIYDANLEKLTGHATYRPVGDCDVGTFALYRIKLKSAATVPAGALSTVRVSGRDVQWFADADLKQPLATGNTYRTKLGKTTTFYLKQDYYPTDQSAVVPITIRVAGTKAKAGPPPPAPPVAAPPASGPPAAARADTARPAPPPTAAPPLAGPAPVLLPTVLFQVGKAKLLPNARPALDQLAAELNSRPAVRLRVLGHTDRVGEPDKNQLLSEQRAAAVKAYLVKAGVAPERVDAVGYGDARPLYPSPDARNRRVEAEEVN